MFTWLGIQQNSDYFASFYEACVIFDNFKHQIQFNSKAIEGFQAWLWIKEDDKSTVFAMTNKIHMVQPVKVSKNITN